MNEEWKIESAKKTSFQPNQISQGLYKCSPMAKRLLAYTISNLKIVKWNKNSEPQYEARFKSTEFAKSLGLQRIGSKQQQLIKDALEELQASYIAIDTGDVFRTFAWVTETLYSTKDKSIYISLNQKLGQALVEFQKGYTTIQLLEIGKLQSFYAMRFYEIAYSWKGKKGLCGNKKNEWFFEYSLQQLRNTFQLADDEYAGRTNNLIIYVIQKPLAELNEKTNLLITFEKIKDGKEVIGFHFTCTEKATQLKIEKTDSFEEKREKNIINSESNEIDYYKNKYPEEFNKIYQEEKNQQALGFQGISFDSVTEFETVKHLKKLGFQ